MTEPGATLRIEDNPAEGRYELFLDGRRVGLLDYELPSPGRIVLAYVEVDPDLEGRGLGARLTEHALWDSRRRGLRVTPTCPFIIRYLREHPEHQDLVDPASG